MFRGLGARNLGSDQEQPPGGGIERAGARAWRRGHGRFGLRGCRWELFWAAGRGWPRQRREKEEGRMFFFEKKNQKTFAF
jgi:hypothetical protein